MNYVITYDQQSGYKQWLENRLGKRYKDPEARTITMIDPDTKQILAVAVLTRWISGGCEISGASDVSRLPGSGWEFQQAIFNYVFNVAERFRLTAIVSVDNHKSLAMMRGVGFHEEGILYDWFGEGQDAIIFRFTKDDWKQQLQAINKEAQGVQ